MANPVANPNFDQITLLLTQDPLIHTWGLNNIWMCRASNLQLQQFAGVAVIRRVAIHPWNVNDIRIGCLTEPSNVAQIDRYEIPFPHMENGIWVYDNMVQERVNAITKFVLNFTPLQIGRMMILHECLTMLDKRVEQIEKKYMI